MENSGTVGAVHIDRTSAEFLDAIRNEQYHYEIAPCCIGAGDDEKPTMVVAAKPPQPQVEVLASEASLRLVKASARSGWAKRCPDD